MKNTTKDNKGITLISLIITVIIMLILVSVTTFTGLDAYKSAKVNKFVTQMQLLQTKIDDLVAASTTDELNNISIQPVTSGEQTNAIVNAFKQGEIINADTSKYRVFTPNDISNILDVEDIQDDILVNFETREIVSIVGIEYNDKIYYTQYKLPGGQTIIYETSETVRDLSFDSNLVINGLNGTITISGIKITNGTLSYKETNSNYWTTVSNHTKKGNEYIVNISKNGEYTVKLHDNLNSDKYTEKTISITVANKPKTGIQLEEYNYGLTSDKWAYAQKNNTNYVWIPRFAYDKDNNIKFIKGNSNIATDNTYIDNTWRIHDKFATDNFEELTGIWVSVENTNTTDLNMITLLNDSNKTILIEI